MYAPTITVCTDAGFSARFKFGVWACYIRTPHEVIKHSAILKGEISGSGEAEKKGLANALHILTLKYNLSKYRLVIYCDNETVLHAPLIKKTPASALYIEQAANREWWLTHIGNVAATASSYELRHVKGHLTQVKWDKTSKRNYMNAYCDQECRRIYKRELKLRKQLYYVDKEKKHDEEYLAWSESRKLSTIGE